MKNWVLCTLLVVVALCSAEQGWSKDGSLMDDANVVLQMQPSCSVSVACDGKVATGPNTPVSVALYSFGLRTDVASKEGPKLRKWSKDVLAGHFQDKDNVDFDLETHLSVCVCFDKAAMRLAFLQRLNI